MTCPTFRNLLTMIVRPWVQWFIWINAMIGRDGTPHCVEETNVLYHSLNPSALQKCIRSSPDFRDLLVMAAERTTSPFEGVGSSVATFYKLMKNHGLAEIA